MMPGGEAYGYSKFATRSRFSPGACRFFMFLLDTNLTTHYAVQHRACARGRR